jgi:thiol-disulfide isomerase/thioredoxin
MNSRIFFIVWLSLFALAAVFPASRVFAQRKTKTSPKTAAAKPLPNLTLNTIDGQKWSLEENRGRVVLINFWATWCAPCRTEIPALVRLSNEYKASGLEVVGISVDSENIEQINGFIKDYKINYPILLAAPGSLLSRRKAVPMTLLVDQTGVLAKKYVGAAKESVFEKDIKDLFAKKSARTEGNRNSKQDESPKRSGKNERRNKLL